MDFSFTQEQDMLRESVAKLLERNYDFDTRQALVSSDAPWSADVWAQFAELGLTMLPFSEEQGGLGGSVADCVAFAGAFGEHLVVEPYVASTVLAGGALSASGTPEALEWIENVKDNDFVSAVSQLLKSSFNSRHVVCVRVVVDQVAEDHNDASVSRERRCLFQ